MWVCSVQAVQLPFLQIIAGLGAPLVWQVNKALFPSVTVWSEGGDVNVGATPRTQWSNEWQKTKKWLMAKAKAEICAVIIYTFFNGEWAQMWTALLLEFCVDLKQHRRWLQNCWNKYKCTIECAYNVPKKAKTDCDLMYLNMGLQVCEWLLHSCITQFL